MKSLYDTLMEIQDTFGIRICVHDMSGVTFTSQMLQLPYEWKSHHCAYCLAVKQAVGVNRCVAQKSIALRVLRQGHMRPYYGICRAGMCDYILPVESDGRLLAIIFASGIAREDADRCRQKLKDYMESLNQDAENPLREMERLYAKNLVTRNNLRFFAEFVRDMLLRYAGSHLSQSPSENQPLPVAALSHTRSDMMTSVLSYIDENYASNLTVPQLADMFIISEGHLSRRFHEETGMSIVKYIRQRRINVAAGQLTMTNDSIAQVSERVGYDDPNYFCRVFRNLMGLTPTQYRQRHQGREVEMRQI